MNLEIKNHAIKVQKTAYFYTLGLLNNDTEHLWVVCHGYGQLGKYFINKFQALQQLPFTAVVAVEGLSRFYKHGMGGNVGATWMTKEDRDNDIADYIAYLDQVMEHIKPSIGVSCKIHVLGFSQGAATASRWVDSGRIVPNNLILWSGAFAHDLKLDFNKRLVNVGAYTVSGHQDTIMTPDLMHQQVKALEDKGFVIHHRTFDGGHEIDATALLELASELQIVEP